MPLFTEEDLNQLRNNGLTVCHTRDFVPVVRLILPASNCVWLLTEILPYRNERFAAGLTDLGNGTIQETPINLAALEVMADPYAADRYRLQRDPAFSPKHPISVYWIAAMMFGYLTDDPAHLDDALQFMREGWESTVTHVPQTVPSFAVLKPS